LTSNISVGYLFYNLGGEKRSIDLTGNKPLTTVSENYYKKNVFSNPDFSFGFGVIF